MTTLRKPLYFLLVCFLAANLVSQTTRAQESPEYEHILVETNGVGDRISKAIQAQGGRVTAELRYADALAADVPASSIETIRNMVAPAAISKDVRILGPRNITAGGIRNARELQTGPVVTNRAKSGRPIVSSGLSTFASTHPQAYVLNNLGTRIDKLHAQGFTGENTIVALIDSGYRPGFSYLDSDHSLIGGIDFVGDGNGFSNIANDGHGTFVAGLISGKGFFAVSDTLHDAIQAYAPAALDPQTGELALIGTAPSAKIYAVRVFGVDASTGAPLSVILKAIQHVIDLRKDWDESHGTRGLKIDVCNLSLGVRTLAAGRTLLDRSIDALLRAGIVPVVGTGNTGPSSLTVASPGSSMSALTVGGITRAANDRILAELLFGPGTGALYHPSSGTQTSWFSSRGPNADGRLDPDVVANGMANFAQGYCPAQVADACDNDLSIASGTSYSTSIVSGIVLALRQAFPQATATELRNSVIASGRRSLITDGSTTIDDGNGVPDAVGAFNLLNLGNVPGYLSDPVNPSPDVERNVERNTDLVVYSGNVQLTTGFLKPGQRFDLLYRVEPGTREVIVALDDFQSSLPPSQQNPFFGGDDMFVNIHSAKTSSIGAAGDYILGFYTQESPFVSVDSQFQIDDPDTGIMRITLLGDFINAGKISAGIHVHSIVDALPAPTVRGIIHNGETRTIPVVVPPGTHNGEFLLSWGHDWGHYPTSDIDMTLINPVGRIFVNKDGKQPGVSQAGPERASIKNPHPGTWQVLIKGFDIPEGTDNFELRVTLDGQIQ